MRTMFGGRGSAAGAGAAVKPANRRAKKGMRSRIVTAPWLPRLVGWIGNPPAMPGGLPIHPTVLIADRDGPGSVHLPAPLLDVLGAGPKGVAGPLQLVAQQPVE